MIEKLVWHDHLGVGSLSEIISFEQRNSFVLPAAYKEIAIEHEAAYLDFGWTFRFFNQLSSEQVESSIGIFVPFRQNEDGAMTMDEVLGGTDGLPKRLIPFSMLGNGDLLCFDYRGQPNDGNPKVVMWHHEASAGTKEEISEIALDFDAFLGELQGPRTSTTSA